MQKPVDQHWETIIYPHRIALFLGSVVLFLAAGHIAVNIANHSLAIKSTPMAGLFQFFNMGDEANLPTYVSALYLLLAGGLCVVIARNESTYKKRPNWHWWGLSFGLLLMSVDEAAQIHEGVVGAFLLALVGRGEGFFYYAWFKIYIPIVLIIAFLYVPFLRRLPLRYALRFMLCGLIYLGGALGIEMLESYLAYYNRSTGLNILFEETFEMLGIVLLIHTFLLYIFEFDHTLKFTFTLNKDRPNLTLKQKQALNKKM